MFPFADTNPTKRWEIVTFAIVAINVLAQLWVQAMPSAKQNETAARWGFVPARIAQLSDPNLVVEVPLEEQLRRVQGGMVAVPHVVQLPANPQQILASAVTCMFLHGGWMHLIGNMWFLLIFGNNIEDRLGHLLYAIFYLAGGLAATATHWAIDPTSNVPVIGASGAVAAVLGGYIVTFPHARIKTLIMLVVFISVVELPAYVFLFIWFGMQLFSGLGTLGGQMGGVAWWAHVGGFVAGAALMPILSMVAPKRDDGPTPPDDSRDEFWPSRHKYDDRHWG